MVSRRTHIFILSLFGAVLIFFALLTAFYSLLPGYLEKNILPGMVDSAGLGPVQLQIRRVGFSGADIGAVRLGRQAASGLLIDTIRIDYRPLALFRGRIDGITISGLSLAVAFDRDGRSVGGIDLQALRDGAGSDSQRGTKGPFFSLGRLSIRNSLVTCRVQGMAIHIPFEMKLIPSPGMRGIDRFLLQLSPRDQQIHLAGSIDPDLNQARLSITGDGIALGSFSDFLGNFTTTVVKGQADIAVKADVVLSPFRISTLDASCRLHRPMITDDGMVLRAPGGTEAKGMVSFELKTDGSNRWHFNLSPFSAGLSGKEITVSAEGRAILSGETLSVTADAYSKLQAFSIGFPPFRWGVTAEYDKGGAWHARLNGRIDAPDYKEKRLLQITETDIYMGPPEVTLSAKGSGEGVLADYTLQAPNVSVRSEEGRIRIPLVTIKGNARHASPGQSQASFAVHMPQIRLAAKDVSGHVPGVDLKGALTRSKDGAWGLNALASFSRGKMRLSSPAISLDGISGKIPFKWPLKGVAPNGKFSIKSIQLEHLSLGELGLLLQQRGEGVVFSGKQPSLVLPALIPLIDGEVRMGKTGWHARARVRVPEYAPKRPVDLGRFYPQAAGAEFSGKINLTADLVATGSSHGVSLDCRLQDGALRLAASDLSVEGISTHLILSDVLAAKSLAMQPLHVSKIILGDIVATDLAVAYQIESPQSVFIEQSRFKWCGGSVNTQSFRIAPGVADYRLSLYCDRLNLAQLLEQFGAAKADGEGTVNGRIPVSFTNGRLEFQDGFLYSTPGGGGKISVKGTEMLTAGLPPDSLQYMQMDLAREALKDFDYQWVKMNLSSEGSDFVIGLNFDGKPAGPLPFKYKKEFGGFARVTVGSKGSNFQGIRLDVNFKLPLYEILKYKEIVNLMK